MDIEINELRRRTVARILAKQDEQFRWGFDEQVARERPRLVHYWPKYRSTLWTLLLLADIGAPADDQRVDRSIDIVMDHFYDESHKIFTLEEGRFPVPCLNGNLLYLHFCYKRPYTTKTDRVVEFFNSYQRFDDGDFKTPESFPYFSNTGCYGKHTCIWGVTKLLKGLSFIPASDRTESAQRLIENCIGFILHHEVCFRSHDRDEFIHPHIGRLTFPNLVQSDYLEILWLLARERIKHEKMSRAAKLVRSKMMSDGSWALERPMSNLTVSIGRKGRPNAFITERASTVLDYYSQEAQAEIQ